VEDFAAADRAPSGQPPVSVHFVNNVLAAAAGYIEDDPDEARDVLALLSQFLSYRLRAAPGAVPVEREMEHVATYLRLEQARFPDRIVCELPEARDVPGGRVPRAGIQAPVAEGLGRRLSERIGPCRLVLRVRPGRPELDLELAAPEDAPGAAEHVRIPLAPEAVEAL
jgi:LytS/YehU family sensor histidine kinase